MVVIFGNVMLMFGVYDIDGVIVYLWEYDVNVEDWYEILDMVWFLMFYDLDGMLWMFV